MYCINTNCGLQTSSSALFPVPEATRRWYHVKFYASAMLFARRINIPRLPDRALAVVRLRLPAPDPWIR